MTEGAVPHMMRRKKRGGSRISSPFDMLAWDTLTGPRPRPSPRRPTKPAIGWQELGTGHKQTISSKTHKGNLFLNFAFRFSVQNCCTKQWCALLESSCPGRSRRTPPVVTRHRGAGPTATACHHDFQKDGGRGSLWSGRHKTNKLPLSESNGQCSGSTFCNHKLKWHGRWLVVEDVGPPGKRSTGLRQQLRHLRRGEHRRWAKNSMADVR